MTSVLGVDLSLDSSLVAEELWSLVVMESWFCKSFGRRVAAVGGWVDTDRAGGHLTDGYYVGELGGGHPVPVLHRLVLDEGEHAVASAEAEEANLEECYE